MIDWGRVTELRDEVGTEDFMEIAEIFLSEMTEAIDPLRNGTVPMSLPELLHYLKGASLNVGFFELARACAEGERSPDTVEIDAIVALFDLSRDEFLEGIAAPA